MRAYLHSARIAPKKVNLIASMVRRKGVFDALALLEHLPKKGARILHALVSSAAANAEHNDQQQRSTLRIKSLVVQKGPAFKRQIPMARGRTRPIDKWTSHITVELGVVVPEGAQTSEQDVAKKKTSASTAAPVTEGVPALPVPEHASKKERGPKEFDASRGPRKKGPDAGHGPTFQVQHRSGRGS